MNKPLSTLSGHIAAQSGIPEQTVANALHTFIPDNARKRAALAPSLGLTVAELNTVRNLSIAWHRANAG